MIIEFSQKIMICRTDNLPETIESPFSEFDRLFSNINIVPDIQEKQDRPGSLFEFDLSVVVDNTYKSVLDKYRNSRSFVLLLFDTNGNQYQVGSIQTPVRATISPVRFVYELKMTAKLLSQPF